MDLRELPILTLRRKEANVAGQVLNHWEAGPNFVPRTIGASRESLKTVVASEDESFEHDMAMESTIGAEGIGCVRGTTLAIAMEAAVAICLYAVWELVHRLW